MATYRLFAQIISRATGLSVIAAASYRAAEKLHDERLGESHDFRRKAGVEHAEIMLPKDTPAWMADRSKPWNVAEGAEKRKDSQLAREVQVSLPRELTLEQQVSLVRTFAKEQMVDRGMLADVSIHHDNPDTAPPFPGWAYVRVASEEEALRKRLNEIGARWLRKARLWRIRADRVSELGLENRLVPAPVKNPPAS